MVSYLTLNFITLMILLAIIALMIVNKEVEIPATRLFIISISLLFVITIVGYWDVYTDVSTLNAADAARVVKIRLIASAAGYILRPFVILTQVLIILQGKKNRLLCIIPAVINAIIYSTALFGSRLAFSIDSRNGWGGGPLSTTVYVVQLIYLLILLFSTLRSFQNGEAWECDPNSSLERTIHTKDDFGGWDAWKEYIRNGFDATVSFKRDGNVITVITENTGISIRDVLTLNEIDRKIFAAITGDQIAVTNIRIKKL